jgi:hypothetical protein
LLEPASYLQRKTLIASVADFDLAVPDLVSGVEESPVDDLLGVKPELHPGERRRLAFRYVRRQHHSIRSGAAHPRDRERKSELVAIQVTATAPIDDLTVGQNDDLCALLAANPDDGRKLPTYHRSKEPGRRNLSRKHSRCI